jgi:hypothetical protein
MRYALVLGLSLLWLGCGDDDPGRDAGAEDRDAVTWNCTCWSLRDMPGASRSEEEITYCSADDPTDGLSDRYADAAAELDLMGGCDPCSETQDSCVPQD